MCNLHLETDEVQTQTLLQFSVSERVLFLHRQYRWYNTTLNLA